MLAAMSVGKPDAREKSPENGARAPSARPKAAKRSAKKKKAGGMDAEKTVTKPAAKRAASKTKKKTAAKRATGKAKAPGPANGATAAKQTAATKTAKKRKAVLATPEPAEAEAARGGLLPPVAARPSRGERARAEARLAEIDVVCNAWADIVAERITADQTFADLVEQLDLHSRRDLRGLFLWDALQAAESHVSIITEVIASHLDQRKADPVAILADLRARQREIAAVYSVNAFLAVLNQMSPSKPRWLATDDLDPRFAVLALAHQTLTYATEAAGVSAPPDITDHIIQATQDEAVWVWRRMPEPGTETLAACAATAAFFRLLGADVLVTTDEVAAHYAERARTRG